MFTYARIVVTVLFHCAYQSLRHPLTPICQIANPTPIIQSPIPWWGSIGVILLGICSWISGDVWHITGLTEAARAMVYIPLGNIFGMSLNVAGQVRSHRR
jgi:hypothetical protein